MLRLRIEDASYKLSVRGLIQLGSEPEDQMSYLVLADVLATFTSPFIPAS